MSIYFRPNSASAPAFFTDSTLSEGLVWAELVYQNTTGRVGLNLDAAARSFLDVLLNKAWRFDRRLRRFIYEANPSLLNGHDLQNLSAIAVVQPNQNAIDAFKELELANKVHERNELLARLKKQVIEPPLAKLDCCIKTDSKYIDKACVQWLCSNCDFLMLLRLSEHGLHAGLFSTDLLRINNAVELSVTKTGCDILQIASTDPLPSW